MALLKVPTLLQVLRLVVPASKDVYLNCAAKPATTANATMSCVWLYHKGCQVVLPVLPGPFS